MSWSLGVARDVTVWKIEYEIGVVLFGCLRVKLKQKFAE
jgi:hypothetical protein